MSTKPIDILLVEDSPEDVELTTLALQENAPSRLNVVENGENAVLYLRKQGDYIHSATPDIIILDINLPRKNGFEVLKEIKNDPQLDKTSVIIFTGADLTEEVLKKNGLLREQVIRKAGDYSDLAQAVNKIALQPSCQNQEEDTLSSVPKPGLKILVVEDNHDDVELLKEILFIKEKYEWRLQHVVRLSEALTRLNEEVFDAVILDLTLPDSRGLDTIKKVREHKSKVPIVVTTGVRDEETGIEAVRNGAQDYLIKGQISADLFIRSVQYAIERANLEHVREELIGYVNHELNNPLTVIMEGISQVADGILGEVNEKQKQFLGKALLHIKRLVRITDDLLDSTMLEFGKVALKKDTFDIVDLGKNALESFRSLAAKKNLDICFNSEQKKLDVYADKDRIQQVFFNLLNNALKYTEKGLIELTIKDKGPVVECAVSDSGNGIKEEDRVRIFRKFERLDPSKLNNAKGAGLGLFICHELVKLHSGNIWVKSKMGEGSQFIFTLPKEKPL